MIFKSVYFFNNVLDEFKLSILTCSPLFFDFIPNIFRYSINCEVKCVIIGPALEYILILLPFHIIFDFDPIVGDLTVQFGNDVYEFEVSVEYLLLNFQIHEWVVGEVDLRVELHSVLFFEQDFEFVEAEQLVLDLFVQTLQEFVERRTQALLAVFVLVRVLFFVLVNQWDFEVALRGSHLQRPAICLAYEFICEACELFQLIVLYHTS